MSSLPLRNPVLERLREGKVCIGVGCSSGCPLAIEVLGVAGLDWVMLDIEHSPIDVALGVELIRASERIGMIPVARIAANDPVWIKRFLDAGAMGLIIPLIKGVDEARQAADWARFPPQGNRPYGGGRVGNIYGNQYLRTANEQILLLTQVETKGAVRDLQEILAIEEIDGCLVGPTDLSLAYGLPIPAEGGSKEREDLIAKLGAIIRGAGKVAAIVAGSAEEAQRRIDQGYQLISIASDISLIRAGASKILEQLQKRLVG